MFEFSVSVAPEGRKAFTVRDMTLTSTPAT